MKITTAHSDVKDNSISVGIRRYIIVDILTSLCYTSYMTKKRTTIYIDEAVLLSATIKCAQNKTKVSRYIEQLIVKDLESEVIYKKGKTNE